MGEIDSEHCGKWLCGEQLSYSYGMLGQCIDGEVVIVILADEDVVFADLVSAEISDCSA